MELNCFLCNHMVPGELNGLSSHFRSVHGITITHGLKDVGFICSQNGCQNTYKNLYGLRRHIRTNHLSKVDHVNNFRIENYPAQEIGNAENENVNNENLPSGTLEIDETCMENSDQTLEEELRIFVIRMIGKLQCNGSLTGVMMQNFFNEFEEILCYLRDKLNQQILSKLTVGKIVDQDLILDIKKILEFNSPFDRLRTYDQQVTSLIKECGYIHPEQIPLGQREDTVFDNESCCYVRAQIIESFQYVSIIDVLKLVLSNKSIRQVIASEQPSPNYILSSSIDGLTYKNHVFFQKYKNAIRIKLYYDELEIVNPLGSKTGVHKLGVFYYQIDNLPHHMNSELSSIHVLLICSYANIRRFQFEKILQPFMVELGKLESDEGISLTFANEEYVLRASLMAFCGDTLAVHDVFNHLGPSANLFCRMCMYNREDLHSGNLTPAICRSRELYEQHLEKLKQNNFSSAVKTETGLKGECSLNNSRYFHISQNKIFDIMHDLLCGVCPMVIKLVLHRFVCIDNIFNVTYLNNAILLFNYGYINRKNKPSPNFTRGMLNKKDHTLSQKAMQIWCLIRAMPFILSEKVEEENNFMQIILYLLRIMEIVFAPKLPASLLPYLEVLIRDFIQCFMRLFPDVDLINKIHHMTHYAECIEYSGPLAIYSCERFEAKHNELKQRALNINNFKNPPKTLIKICQCVQSARWSGADVPLHKTKIISGKSTFVANTLSRLPLKQLSYSEDDEVFSGKLILVDGVEFRKGLFILLQKTEIMMDNSILFGKIVEIIVKNNFIYFYTLVWQTICFDTELHAYHIEEAKHDFRLIEKTELQFYKPFSSWTKPNSENVYISLRHLIF